MNDNLIICARAAFHEISTRPPFYTECSNSSNLSAFHPFNNPFDNTMNRIDRLLGILLLLQRRRRVRAEDLAHTYEVSERLYQGLPR